MQGENKVPSANNKVTLVQAPWEKEVTDKEESVWGYLVKNRRAEAKEVAEACGVKEEYVDELVSRIGSPNWREETSALDAQVGGEHYKNMSVQPWQALEAWLTPDEYRGYHKATAISYLARERSKGGMQDIQKAIHHLQRLVEMQGDNDAKTNPSTTSSGD